VFFNVYTDGGGKVTVLHPHRSLFTSGSGRLKLSNYPLLSLAIKTLALLHFLEYYSKQASFLRDFLRIGRV